MTTQLHIKICGSIIQYLPRSIFPHFVQPRSLQKLPSYSCSERRTLKPKVAVMRHSPDELEMLSNEMVYAATIPSWSGDLDLSKKQLQKMADKIKEQNGVKNKKKWWTFWARPSGRFKAAKHRLANRRTEGERVTVVRAKIKLAKTWLATVSQYKLDRHNDSKRHLKKVSLSSSGQT